MNVSQSVMDHALTMHAEDLRRIAHDLRLEAADDKRADIMLAALVMEGYVTLRVIIRATPALADAVDAALADAE